MPGDIHCPGLLVTAGPKDNAGLTVSHWAAEWTPTRPQLVLFSGLTWNPHLIHVNPAAANVYGLADVVVHAQLHAAVITELCLRWLGPGWQLTRVDWQTRRPAYVDVPLRVLGALVVDDCHRRRIDVTISDPDGTVCVTGAVEACNEEAT